MKVLDLDSELEKLRQAQGRDDESKEGLKPGLPEPAPVPAPEEAVAESNSRRSMATDRMARLRQRGSTGELAFCADVMLGKLAKWLRIAGFDTTYACQDLRDRVIEAAVEAGRIILTRGHREPRGAGGETADWIAIESDQWRLQFAQVMEMLNLPYEALEPTSRCSRCNDVLVEVARQSVHCLVPDFVFRTQHRFRRCPSCETIFWAGTHTERIKDELEDIYLRFLFRCSHCGIAVEPGKLKYKGSVDVTSVYEPLEITDEDLSENHWPEINRLLGEIQDMDEETLTESVYSEFRFALCAGCKERFLMLLKTFFSCRTARLTDEG